MTTPAIPPEFSRTVRASDVSQRRQHSLGANAGERAALAGRFDLLALDRLEATLELRADGGVILLTGHFSAAGAQPCVRTRAPVPFVLAEPISLRLIPEAPAGEDLELASEDLDSEPLSSDIIDLGEYVAQALALALDPYPRSDEPAPGVLSEEQARVASSPFAVRRKE